MPVTTGTYTVGHDDGSLRVYVKPVGRVARAGHDLVMEATAWMAIVDFDAETPANSSVVVAVDARSLVVREATGGAIAITDRQREDIARNARNKVLLADRFPAISARSTAVSGTPAAAVVAVDLTVAGRTRRVSLEVRVEESGMGDRVTASTSIVQTDFGITPFTALFGALRVRDEVEITVEAMLPVHAATVAASEPSPSDAADGRD